MLIISIIVLELLVIWYIIWDNVTWQKTALRNAGVQPKKKIKLKKGQRIAFAVDDEINPFEYQEG